MRVQRIQARQGHPVPDTAQRSRGPFPAELYASAPIVTDYEPEGEGVPPEGTAQNGYRAFKWYRCRQCLGAVREDCLDEHECEEADDQEG